MWHEACTNEKRIEGLTGGHPERRPTEPSLVLKDILKVTGTKRLRDRIPLDSTLGNPINGQTLKKSPRRRDAAEVMNP